MSVSHTDGLAMVAPPEPGFTGDVGIGGYFRRELPSRLAGAVARFAPGARTPWKVNPAGQTLVVLSGRGLMRIDGEPSVRLRAGDVVWCPPGRRHWDGATPGDTLLYVAVQEELEASVSFVGPVGEEEYRDALDGIGVEVDPVAP